MLTKNQKMINASSEVKTKNSNSIPSKDYTETKLNCWSVNNLDPNIADSSLWCTAEKWHLATNIPFVTLKVTWMKLNGVCKLNIGIKSILLGILPSWRLDFSRRHSFLKDNLNASISSIAGLTISNFLFYRFHSKTTIFIKSLNCTKLVENLVKSWKS